MNQAVGCKSTCIFCNRKCELLPHNPEDYPYAGEDIGHQQRVFTGNQYVNKNGHKFPCLGNCQTVKPDEGMLIDGNKTVWPDFVNRLD